MLKALLKREGEARRRKEISRRHDNRGRGSFVEEIGEVRDEMVDGGLRVGVVVRWRCCGFWSEFCDGGRWVEG